MRCPNCYGKIDKISNVCTKCGFKTKELNNASNKQAKEMKRQGDGDLCIETYVLPADVSKKKLLLFSIFLGLFGAHYFYVGKMLRGFINLVFSVFYTVTSILRAIGIMGGILEYAEFVIAFGFVMVLLCTISDIVNIM